MSRCQSEKGVFPTTGRQGRLCGRVAHGACPPCIVLHFKSGVYCASENAHCRRCCGRAGGRHASRRASWVWEKTGWLAATWHTIMSYRVLSFTSGSGAVCSASQWTQELVIVRVSTAQHVKCRSGRSGKAVTPLVVCRLNTLYIFVILLGWRVFSSTPTRSRTVQGQGQNQKKQGTGVVVAGHATRVLRSLSAVCESLFDLHMRMDGGTGAGRASRAALSRASLQRLCGRGARAGRLTRPAAQGQPHNAHENYAPYTKHPQ